MTQPAKRAGHLDDVMDNNDDHVDGHLDDVMDKNDDHVDGHVDDVREGFK